MADDPLRTVTLNGGVEVSFFDRSNRYFGDYHQLKVEVEVILSVHGELLPEELRTVLGKVPATVNYRKTLTRMGVPSARYKETCHQLMDDFLKYAGPYLEHRDFPLRLLQEQLER